MTIIEQQVGDAEALAEYARRNGIAVPAATSALIDAARGKLPGLANPGADRDAFLQALADISALVPVPAAALATSGKRRALLAPLSRDASVLLEFAATTAKKVDDEVRKTLLASMDAVNRGTPTLQDEQSFYKAYEALTCAVAPVTAETIAASKTRLPTFRQFFLSKEDFWKSWEGLTLGRFFDALVFLVVLIATCFTLGYHSVGSEAMRRLQELDKQLADAKSAVAKNGDLADLRAASIERKKGEKPPGADVLEADQKALADAKRELQGAIELRDRLSAERDGLPHRLWRWSQQPCQWALVAVALCPSVDAVPGGDEPASDTARVAPAAIVLVWMNQIVLPLLLGWLGSHAFVIRKMTTEIKAMTFAKGSTIHHIARLALGALAGVASGWLFTPEVVSSQLKNVPAWVLAFVAGYGIELVFEFLDRVIGAFTNKKP